MRLNGLGAGTSVFRPDTWDFGTIRETDGRVSHTFTGVNRGDSPLVILDVVTTCGCTVPDFSKKPILPGEKTQITVTYDPANRPGSFTKELWVYSSEKRKIATLTVQGSVIPRQKTVEELYPVDAGGGLRLASTLNAFSYIYPGRQVQAAIGYANTSKRPVRLELRPETTSGALRPTIRNRSRRANGAKSTSPTSSRRQTPLRDRARRAGGPDRRTQQRHDARHPRHRRRSAARGCNTKRPESRFFGKYP